MITHNFALLKKGLRICDTLQLAKLMLQFRNIFEGPRLSNGTLKHEGMTSALPETKKLKHETSVAASSFTLCKEGVEIGTESVLSLYKVSQVISSMSGWSKMTEKMTVTYNTIDNLLLW